MIRRNLRYLAEIASKRGWRYDLAAASVSESLSDPEFYASLNPSKPFESLSDQELTNFKNNRRDFQLKKVSQIAASSGIGKIEDFENVSSCQLLNFVEEAEQFAAIAPEDEKFFLDLATAYFSCDIEKAEEFKRKYEKTHWIPAFFDQNASENDQMIDRTLFNSYIPHVSAILARKEIEQLKQNDKKITKKEREALGFRRLPNPFVMFARELRQKLKDQKLSAADVSEAWNKLSPAQKEIAEKTHLQRTAENDARNGAIAKKLLNDRNWNLLTKEEIILHGEDSDLFEFQNFWEKKTAAFDAYVPEIDPILKIEKISDTEMRKNIRKQRSFPIRTNKLQITKKMKLPGSTKEIFENMTSENKKKLEKEFALSTEQYKKDFLAARKRAIADKAYLALTKADILELGTKQEQQEWTEAWEEWQAKTSF
ncbi:Oidioi.mRNA.OKI2018_I69.PAR.g9364.t1.cds [Oikopleura dioica]|uniref:Oidioi.mRNA.OKI2018_I69.PAR.g9364.t1.cds n=1 Tax=Oikopleura dioica TaxID=34765 RepID=A0ABN7RK68_OIKDI|nr:Oidioi.mRNA.OKI2018_I69.PAR.g9364.t1.cds [Oikopleura dioica]